MCPVRAAARICSEAGAWVTTNTCVADLSIPSVHRLDDRRIRGHCQWPAIVGRVPACSRHDPSFPARTGGTTSSVQRSICGGSPARCPPPQRTNLPRTRCGWSMSFGRSCSRNWGALERRDLRLLANHRARQTPALLRQAVSAALLHRWLALLCHAAFGLRSIPARLGFHIIHQHWQRFPIHQQPAWPRPFGLRRAQPLFPQSPIIGLSISGHWPV